MPSKTTTLEELSQKLPELMDTVNDKLTVILCNAEIALFDLAGEGTVLLTKQLHTIAMLSEEIGVINGKIMGLVAGAYSNQKEE